MAALTPLQTPPPVSAPLQAAPLLKQQNLWIMDEPADAVVETTPSVSFPVLMPQRNAIPAAASTPAADQHLPAPALQPQSFEFLKFPSLNRDVRNDDMSRDQTTVAVQHPLPIRPTRCYRSPSLQLLEDESIDLPSQPTNPLQHTHRPQLKIQSFKSETSTPSHLARRGFEERTYLESQLRAEELMRRKHALENEERKAREMRVEVDDEQDNEVSALMEKFTDFQLDRNEQDFRRWIPARNKRSNRDNAAPTPPPVILKSFKRSVSAVIAESRGNDDDACVLFFPDGLPLVDECNESLRGSMRSLEHNSFDELDSKCTLSPGVTDCTTMEGTLSCHSTPRSVELLLEEGGGHKNKKVMLRPKMTVRPKTPAKEGVPDQIDCSQRLFVDLSDALETLEDEKEGEHVEVTCEPRSRSFKRLDSETTIVRKNGKFDSELPCANSIDCSLNSRGTIDYSQSSRGTIDHQQPWDYSSPEPIRRSQFRTNFVPMPPPQQDNQDSTPIEPFQLELREPLSESNYCTPDHSNLTMRKQSGVRPSGVLDTLPELFLPSLNKKSKSSVHADLSSLESQLRPSSRV